MFILQMGVLYQAYFCLSVRQLVSLSQSVPKEKHFKQVREGV